MEWIFLKDHSTSLETQALRKQSSCLLIDHKKMNSNDSFTVVEESFDFRKQPLRLIVISLQNLDLNHLLFNDEFRRNTMIITSDEDVRSYPEVVRALELKGVALLMAKKNATTLDLESLTKSLISLKFQNILVEDRIDLLPELSLMASKAP